MREIRLSGSTSGMWKRSMVRLVRHRQTKGPATDRPLLHHRATSRLYDWIMALTETHLLKTLRSWLPHYNRSRPHSSLGPGLPGPPPNFPVHLQRHRHRFDRSTRIVVHSVLNGLHH